MTFGRKPKDPELQIEAPTILVEHRPQPTLDKLKAMHDEELKEVQLASDKAYATERLILYVTRHPDFEEHFRAISAKLEIRS